jgi:hypothetical protein
MPVEHNIGPQQRIIMDHISRDFAKVKPNFLSIFVLINLIELLIIEANLRRLHLR